jgi:hypothetical protein
MKLKSFGCSFIFGNDLGDDGFHLDYPSPSELTWPALIAKQIGIDYQCFATPGCGNLHILQEILKHSAIDNGQNVFVIGWTWIERFDYINADSDTNWRDPWETICPVSESAQAKLYYRNFHSELLDKFKTLVSIYTAIETLKQKNIPFFMTYMDDLILDKTCHAPLYVTDLQDKVLPYLNSFNGQTFLEWSKNNNFPISSSYHPLELAHTKAADFLLPTVKSIIKV